MTVTLIFAIITITLALIFYTHGVLSERREGTLRIKQLLFFYAGLICDTTGTKLMSDIVASSTNVAAANFSLHAILGGLALILMLSHAIWATFVYLKGNEKSKHDFHKFSLIVWSFWLVPYICGFIIGNPMMHVDKVPAIVISVIAAIGIGGIVNRIHRED